MVRVSQRYFDVLAAEDTLSAAEATLQAFSRQLEQSEKRFEVGLIAITDVQESQAAYDSATAGVIAAKRALASRPGTAARADRRGVRDARQARGGHAAQPAAAGRRGHLGHPGAGAEPQRDRGSPRRRDRQGRRQDRAVGPPADRRPVRAALRERPLGRPGQHAHPAHRRSEHSAAGAGGRHRRLEPHRRRDRPAGQHSDLRWRRHAVTRATAGVPASRLAREARRCAARRRARDARRLPRRDRGDARGSTRCSSR